MLKSGLVMEMVFGDGGEGNLLRVVVMVVATVVMVVAVMTRMGVVLVELNVLKIFL